jgi:signal transduction histidine kinase
MNQRWTARRFTIAIRLRIVFGAVILLMLMGSVLSFLHFRDVSARAGRMSRAEQHLTSVLRLNNNLLALMNQLHRTAEKQVASEFETESVRLLRAFEANSAGTVDALEEIARDDERYRILVGSIVGLLDSMPRRIGSLRELAQLNDWTPLHARLLNQADQTDDVVAALMTRLDADLGQARKQLTQDLGSAQDRAVSTLAVTAALSLAIAVLLGTVVTRSINDPLSSLARGARALAAGDFGHRIPDDGQDELTELARAFNRMAGELDRLFAEVRREHTKTEAAQAALQEHARDLARANADLQQFAYSASHDLQEPLRIITLYSQLLKKRWARHLDPSADECMDVLCNASYQMQQLIAGLLAYTRAGHVEGAEEAPVDMNAVLTRVRNLLRIEIETHGCQLQADELPVVRAHEIHVQQLLQNLISNAIKYRSRDRSPEIRISAERKGRLWEVAVKDNGIGVEPQYFKQIFGMFKRLHGQKYGGTGIGLAICQKIVEGYGGEIWVESVPGEASTFRFTLPTS